MKKYWGEFTYTPPDLNIGGRYIMYTVITHKRNQRADGNPAWGSGGAP
jgi:hypothetical protein